MDKFGYIRNMKKHYLYKTVSVEIYGYLIFIISFCIETKVPYIHEQNEKCSKSNYVCLKIFMHINQFNVRRVINNSELLYKSIRLQFPSVQSILNIPTESKKCIVLRMLLIFILIAHKKDFNI